MKRWTKQLTRATGVVAAGAVLAACGAGGRPAGQSNADTPSDPGITDNSVTVGATFPLTGVAAPGYSEIPSGTQAYFDYVNAHGGVHGRTIKYLVRDDGYNPTTTTSVTKELVLQDKVFAMLSALGTPTHSAVVDYLNSEKVPDLFVSSGSVMWGNDPAKRPETFGWQPDYEIEGKIIGKWVAENMPHAKVGLFLQDDDFGRDGEKGVRQYLDKQIVAVQRYTPGNTDVAPQIAALQSAKADLVLGFNVPAYSALSQLVAMKLNYQPRWFYSNVGADPQLVGSLLASFSKGAVKQDKPLAGVLTTEYISGLDAPDSPWVKLWQKVWDKYGKGGKLTNYRIYGMAEAYTFVQALQAAGANPSRADLVKAVENMGNATGPNLAPYRYSAHSHMGISGMKVVEIQGITSSKQLTPVEVTDLGNAPIKKDQSQAGDAPPADGIPQ